jgi:hypothetical protein
MRNAPKKFHANAQERARESHRLLTNSNTGCIRPAPLSLLPPWGTARGRSTHQFERIAEEFRPAEVAGLEREQHGAFAGANGSQHRYSGSDFRPH